MRSRFNIPGATAIAMALAFPAAASEPDTGTVVATVNGEEITLGHMIVAYATLPQQYRQLAIDVLFDGILDQLVQQTALAQTHGPDLPAHVALSLENERRSLVADSVIKDVMAVAATDEAIQSAYEQAYGNGGQTLEFDASHILVETREQADAIVQELQAGADFAETARSKSTGPSGPHGGALGWFGTGAMVPEFETAVIALEPGQISGPVQTQFGWHVIKLNDTRIKAAPPLDQVRDELALTIQRAAADTHVQALVTRSRVERPSLDGIDREAIRNLGALGD